MSAEAGCRANLLEIDCGILGEAAEGEDSDCHLARAVVSRCIKSMTGHEGRDYYLGLVLTMIICREFAEKDDRTPST